ncbi:MAG: hydrolase [Cryomorphaceae bacterium]|nr:hydrolase [Cryomorphaceae bacterium]
MINPDAKIIAVDFDGTIVEDRYPKIGKPMPFAFDVLKKLQQDGHRLILWTYRHGSKLREAVEFCETNGMTFYAVNKSFAEEDYRSDKMSRKIMADVFIDDRNLGGMKGWGEIYQLISGEMKEEYTATKKKKWKLF